MNGVEPHVSEEEQEDPFSLWEMVQNFPIYEEVSDGNDDEKKKFDEQWKRHLSKFRGIIAFKGLPLTGKTEFALRLGERAKCPVLCIQDFFPSPPHDDIGKFEDAEHCQLMLESAFTRLCNVAKRQLMNPSQSTVVIKSRLNSDFEIRELIKFVTSINEEHAEPYRLLILEFNFSNVFLWKERFDEYKSEEARIEKVDIKWYRSRSWNKMEDAMDNYYHKESQAEWDRHLKQALESISLEDGPHARKLVVDVFDDLFYSCRSDRKELPDDFVNAIKCLLTVPKWVFKGENPFTVKLSEFRPYLLEQMWSALASKGRRPSLCPRASCVFQLLEGVDEEAKTRSLICGVCDRQVLSGMPAYTCRLCNLALCKSCAERIHFERLSDVDLTCIFYHRIVKEKDVCKPCKDEGRGFSLECGSCLFQSHLKCGPLPTILKHDSHPHFLSLILNKQYSPCKACGKKFQSLKDYSYGCKTCAVYYQLECAMLPLELMHKHGGYEHVMKLKYSHNPDDLEKKEVYWCDFCYEEMDPNYWFYSCKHCPYYVAHLKCVGAYEAFEGNCKDLKFVDQIQPQWEEFTRDKKEAHSQLRNQD